MVGRQNAQRKPIHKGTHVKSDFKLINLEGCGHRIGIEGLEIG